jgi:hypothetical protein
VTRRLRICSGGEGAGATKHSAALIVHYSPPGAIRGVIVRQSVSQSVRPRPGMNRRGQSISLSF